MREFGLIGYPLSHSFSKKYFSDKFAAAGIVDCVYENFPIAAISELPALLQSHPQLAGFNITIPYKQQVIEFLWEQSDTVKEIQACNCVKIEKGKLFGFNTDVTGFEQSLLPRLKPWHQQALILGTGGAAKAVEFVLRKLNIGFRYVSRHGSDYLLEYDDLSPDLVASFPLIINTTPLGMYPSVDAYPPIPYEGIGSDHYLFDLVYNPAETVFLKKGAARGAATKNGADMLQIQAEESWKIWNG